MAGPPPLQNPHLAAQLPAVDSWSPPALFPSLFAPLFPLWQEQLGFLCSRTWPRKAMHFNHRERKQSLQFLLRWQEHLRIKNRIKSEKRGPFIRISLLLPPFFCRVLLSFPPSPGQNGSAKESQGLTAGRHTGRPHKQAEKKDDCTDCC